MLLDQTCANDGRQRNDRTYRQVDSSRYNHKSHANRRDNQKCVINEKIKQYLCGEEPRIPERAYGKHHGQQTEGDKDREILTIKKHGG